MGRKVLITQNIPQAGIDLLREKGFTVTIGRTGAAFSGGDLKEYEALLPLLTDKIDEKILQKMPRLKIIANYAVGYNNIDLEAATKRNIAVTNTPGVLTEATADLTWALLMALARLIPQGDRLMREGKYGGWDPMLLLGAEVYGKTLGIIGPGRIGSAVAKRAVGFDMRILYYGRTVNTVLEQETGAERVDFDALLEQADFISLHVPLTGDTRYLIDRPQLLKMKNSAFLINTSRGAVINERALVEALKNGFIAGAGLDVFEREPLLAPGLADLENVVLLPHIGSATVTARTRMAETAAGNIIDFFEGRRPRNLVNQLDLSD